MQITGQPYRCSPAQSQAAVEPDSKPIRSMASPVAAIKRAIISGSVGSLVSRTILPLPQSALSFVETSMPMKYMASPPVDATVHRRAAGSLEFSETETARRNDPILVAEVRLLVAASFLTIRSTVAGALSISPRYRIHPLGRHRRSPPRACSSPCQTRQMLRYTAAWSALRA
jgi:hypothetical protein